MTGTRSQSSAISGLPARAGIGLRFPHMERVLKETPRTGFLEVHSESYLCDGGPRLRTLEALRRDYALSCHGVGLSLGSAEGLDPAHLSRLAAFYRRMAPDAISDHLAWSTDRGTYLNDLLPLPLSEEALNVMARNVDAAQDAFGRRMLVENPSTYLKLAESAIPEPEFLAELVRRTGCGILLDVNNVYVSGCNIGFSAEAYLDAIPADAVGEIHIAGHRHHACGGVDVLLDDHGSTVADEVWALLARTLERIGPRPVLMEWDTAIPELPVLLNESAKADAMLVADQGAEPTRWRA